MRWATFDCYGTLVDWRGGIHRQLVNIFGAGSADGLLERYHSIEPRVQSDDPSASYREVMARVLEELASAVGVELTEDERDALGRSLPDWPVFPDVRRSLIEAHDRGWSLYMLSNTDRDFIEASIEAIGAPFDGAIVASEIGSYKPGLGHWRAFYEETGADGDHHVHVAQSHFHDIVPANELGIRSIWINRLGERGEPRPTRELPDLEGLAGVLDDLVPAG